MADTPAPSAAAPANGEPPLAERDCSGGFQLTPLMKAAIHGDVSLVEKALECTALNLDAVGGDGRTALHTAAANGHRAVVRALADAGCDIDATADGQTAAEIALAAGHFTIFEDLTAEALKREQIWRAINGEATLAAAVAGGASGSKEAPF